MQSKALICRLCMTNLQGITAREFWILFALLLMLFTVLNWKLSRIVYKLVTKETPMFMVKQKQNIYYNRSIPKQTRSGAVYGYL